MFAPAGDVDDVRRVLDGRPLQVVTAVLAGVYALIVLVPTAVVGFGGHAPGWLVAAATLMAAADSTSAFTGASHTRFDYPFLHRKTASSF